MILQTERLLLREMTQEDFPALCCILQDEQTMYAYEGAFSDSEAQVWLDRQLERYRQLGFGLWAVIQTNRRNDWSMRLDHAAVEGSGASGNWVPLQPLLLALRLCHRSGAGVQAVCL